MTTGSGLAMPDVMEKLDTYGANILITPRSDELSLAYGGITLAAGLYAFERLELKPQPVRIPAIVRRRGGVLGPAVEIGQGIAEPQHRGAAPPLEAGTQMITHQAPGRGSKLPGVELSQIDDIHDRRRSCVVEVGAKPITQ